MAGWAEEASLAAERNCDAMPALAAFVTGSAFPRISALQKSLDRMSDNACNNRSVPSRDADSRPENR